MNLGKFFGKLLFFGGIVVGIALQVVVSISSDRGWVDIGVPIIAIFVGIILWCKYRHDYI